MDLDLEPDLDLDLAPGLDLNMDPDLDPVPRSRSTWAGPALQMDLDRD